MQHGYDEKTTTTTWATRQSARQITASTTVERATNTPPSTTPMTMLTSTIAWCTPCVERWRRGHSFTLDVVSHLIGSRSEFLSQTSPQSSMGAPSLSLLSHLLHSDLHPELDNPMVMESLCFSTNKENTFKTQSHWFFFTRQCFNSERFLPVHLSCRMSDQFALYHEFRIDARRTKFEQQTDGILHACGSCEQRTQRSEHNWSESKTSCTVQTENVEETSEHCVLGRYQTLKRTRSNAIILHDTLPVCCFPKAVIMLTGEIIYEKVNASLRPHPKISLIWRQLDERCRFRSCWKWQKLPKKPNQRPKSQLTEQGDLFWQSNHPVRVLRKSKSVSLFGCESTNERTGGFPIVCQCLLDV